MKVFKKLSSLLLITVLVMALMAGCGQQNTVESFVVSNSPFEEKADIEDATQPEKVSENEKCIFH